MLIAGRIKFIVRSSALALLIGDGRHPVKRADLDLLNRHLPSVRVRQGDDDDAEEHKVDDAGEQGRLLAVALGRGETITLRPPLALSQKLVICEAKRP